MNKMILSLRSCFLLFLLASFTAGCDRDGGLDEIVPVSPVANALISPVGHTFEWAATNPNKCRFRLGNPTMSQVLLDTVVSGGALVLPIWLEADAPYHWEVSAGGARLSADFRTEDAVFVQILNGPASDLPVLGGELRWRSTKAGECRLRLTEASGAVVVDTLTTAQSYRLHQVLAPNRDYRLEISQGGVNEEVVLRSANVTVLSLISPAQGDIVPPCCSHTYRWTSGLPGSYRFRMGTLTPAVQLLDTTIIDTQLTVPGILLPGGDYFWEVEQNGTVIRNSFDVMPLEQVFPGSIPGTTSHTYYNDATGFSYSTTSGTISVTSQNGGNAVEVNNNPTFLQLELVGTTSLRYRYGQDIHQYYILDVDLLIGRLVYRGRSGGVGVWHSWEFISQ
jgi:hypothetical protein